LDDVDLFAAELVNDFATRAPLGPMQAPTASTSESLLQTASFVLEPASRETALISTVPS
jgi:hypothetical protein